jgi:hypothetical protein
MRYLLLLSLFASLGNSQNPEFSFCSAGIQPDGYLDWSKLPASDGSAPVVATIPIVGLPNVTATVYIAASLSGFGFGGPTVTNPLQVKFPPSGGQYPLIITFSKPIKGVSTNVRTAGRFGHDALMTVNNADGGVISQAPAQARLEMGGFDYPSAQIAVSPFEVVSRKIDITSVALNQIGSGETYGFELLNFRVQSGAAPDRSTTAVTKNGLAAWFRADVALGYATLFGYGPQAVTQWLDSSGNNLVANGNGGVILDGGACTPVVQGVFQTTLPIDGLTGMTTIIASNTYGDPGGSNNAALFWGEYAPWGLAFFSPSQSAVWWRFGTGQSGNNPSYQRLVNVAGDFTVTSFVHNGTTEYLYVNGLLAQQVGGRLTTIQNASPQMFLGASYVGGQPFPGGIGEVLIYRRALTPDERQRIEMYLMAKYDIH